MRKASELSPDEIKYIEDARAAGFSYEEIATDVGVDKTSVWRIVNKDRLPVRATGLRVTKSESQAEQITKLLEETRKAREALDLKIRELESQKKIAFEYDADTMTVKITGVDRLFQAHQGIAMFREWLTKQFSM